MMSDVQIGIVGIGTYFPETIQKADELVTPSGIPEQILREKMGIVQRHIASEKDSVSYMASQAALQAIEIAGISAEQINMVISHGSQHKDHVIWNSAGKIQHDIGAINAFGFEMYALCAGAPIALNIARSMMLANPDLEYVLLAAGSRENDLINPANQRARFMFNFGSGGGAFLLKRGATENIVMGSSAITDGSLWETVMLTTEEDAIGDGEEINGDLVGWLDVKNGNYMAQRLGEKSMPNFKKVMSDALEKSGYTFDDVSFMGITHMKKSFYVQLLSEVGLTEEQSIYLDHYGHIQSIDQALALQLGIKQGKVKKGDVCLLVGAGTGYTWSAGVVKWG